MKSVRAARACIAGVAALLVCAGCGFKGPLYLPEHNGTVITRPAQAAPAAGQTQTQAGQKKGKDKGKNQGETPASPPPASPPSPPSSSLPPSTPPAAHASPL